MGNNTYDGYFEIQKELDGIYLQIYEAQTGGANATPEEMERDLKAANIVDYDLEPVKAAMKEGFDQIKVKISSFVMTNVADGDEAFRIEVTEDRMMAKITFYPSEAPYDMDAILRKLRARNVVQGIDQTLLQALEAEREYNTPYIVAEGVPAEDGKAAVVEYMFQTEKDTRPEVDEEGNVNYKKLNIIANVQKGQLLAKLLQATDGVPGVNLNGDPIPPRKPKTEKLRYGKNIVINDEKTELYAACNGLVKLFEGKVMVYDVFDVPNNVGPSTGDVEFEGSVIVHGNVITGFTVKAKGDVEVIGVVEGADIISGGNIILHKGIQGMGKGHITAAGFVQARYIENAEVVSGGDVHSEAILHSKVTSKGKVTVEGKKGMISGGSLRVGEGVETKILGSHMGTVTTVEVGIEPGMLAEYADLKKSVPKMEGEVLKLDQVIDLLNKRKEVDGGLDDEKQEMYMSAVRNKIFLSNKLKQGKMRFEELDEMVENKNSGYVKVTNEVYPGVQVSIGSVSTYVREEIRYVKFEKKGADVKMSSI